jgi:hypothetical protein
VITLAVHNGNVEIARALVDKAGVEGLLGEREFVIEFLEKNGIVSLG